jgi:phosphodiesterase/alkaline phosphatase D-like protein
MIGEYHASFLFFPPQHSSKFPRRHARNNLFCPSPIRAGLLTLAACGALASAARSVSAVHLGVSSDPSRLFVQWTLTGAGSDTQRAEYGATPGALTSTAPARVWTWADASTGRQYTSAVAELDALTPGAAFYYRVGSADGWSAVTRSAATRAPADFSAAAPLRVGWLGDLGVVNDQALPYLLNETDLDLFIHVGDCECGK